MDAYDGTMNFYVADPSDPIIRAWQGIFPALFQPIDQMPAGLAATPAGPRGAVQRPDRGSTAVPRDDPLTFFNGPTSGPCPTSRRNSRASSPRPTTS